MAGRNWKRVTATSLSNAMELCIEFAREKHNRSVDHIADLIGLSNKFTLYKWIESGKLPAISIRPFEHACGIDLVTRYLAHSAAKLLIDIPRGRHAGDADDLQPLYESFNAAVGVLIQFYKNECDVPTATVAITGLMEQLAWHRENAAKTREPELDLEQ